MRLLVVDDEASVLHALRAMITTRRPEWDADYINDPAEALRRLIADHYDVVLSDVHMPHLDAITMLHQAEKLLPFTPVVFLTGYKDKYAAAASELGAFAILSKPIDTDALIASLDDAVAVSATLGPKPH